MFTILELRRPALWPCACLIGITGAAQTLTVDLVPSNYNGFNVSLLAEGMARSI